MAKTVTPDGVQIDYVSRGKGKPIFFVHGGLCSQRAWDCQFHALQDRYRCVALDLRGMGQSEKADCKYTFEEFASRRSPHHQGAWAQGRHAGWSMGVSVSLAYMEKYQDDGDVARVVLMNGPIKLISSPGWDFGIEESECMGYINGLADEPINGRRSFAEANLYKPTEAEIDFLFNLSLQTPPSEIGLKAVYNQMELGQRSVLKSLKVPCLAMQSDHDFYPVALGRYISETVPKGHLKIFEDSGHSVQFQDTARFNEALVEFIEST